MSDGAESESIQKQGLIPPSHPEFVREVEGEILDNAMMESLEGGRLPPPPVAQHPGVCVKIDMLEALGLDTKTAAKIMGVSYADLEAFVNERISVTNELAEGLQRLWETTPADFWYDLQRGYDDCPNKCVEWNPNNALPAPALPAPMRKITASPKPG